MTMTYLLNGNEAAAIGVMLSQVEVIPVYPITPQSPLIHKIAELISSGMFDADLVHMESDQSALSAAAGASLAGVRTFTATNSQGLLYMAEVCYYVSGLRLPVVMAVINRAVSAPHSRYPDHSDAMALRSSYWIQVYCSTNQEVLDTTILMYRICENKRVLLPGMFSYESYLLSYTWENVDLPERDDVKEFVGDYNPEHVVLDPSKPLTVNAPTTPEYLTEFRYRQKRAMQSAINVIEREGKNFEREFGRYYALVEPYNIEDAGYVLVTMGSLASTAKCVVDKLRKEGKKAGLLRIRTFRPFPVDEIRYYLRGVNAIATLDRNYSGSVDGVLYDEVRSALYGIDAPPVKGYVAGLGGRNVSRNDIEKIYKELESAKDLEKIEWIGLKGESI